MHIPWPIFFLVSWLISSRSLPLPALLACEGLEVSCLSFLCFQGLFRLLVDASHLFFRLSMPNTLHEKVNFTLISKIHFDYYALSNVQGKAHFDRANVLLYLLNL